jgi:hypothetical protein
MVTQIARLAGIAVIAGLIIISGHPGVFAQSPPGPHVIPSSAPELLLPFTKMGGTIAAYSQVDFYQFSAAAAREVTVWLETESIGSQLAATLAFYDSSGHLLAYNDGEWNYGSLEFAKDPILYLKIPESGKFFLAITSAANFKSQFGNNGATTGAYNITLFNRFDSSIPGDIYEPNDSRGTAKQISLPFESNGTNLLYFGDIDWFGFDAKKGQKISIDIDALEMQPIPVTGVPVKARVGIFDSDGKLLEVPDVGYDMDDGYSGDPSLIFDVPQDARYYIAVTTSADTQFSTLYNNSQFLLDPYVSGATGIIGFYKLTVRELQYLCLPQFAIGSFGSISYETRILLINYSDQVATGSVSLFKSDGTPFSVSFSPPGGSDNTYWFSIQPKGQLILKANGEGPGSSGYAAVTSTAPLAGSAIFSQYDAAGTLITEAAADASSPLDFFAFPVDITGDEQYVIGKSLLPAGRKGWNTSAIQERAARSRKANILVRGWSRSAFSGPCQLPRKSAGAGRFTCFGNRLADIRSNPDHFTRGVHEPVFRPNHADLSQHGCRHFGKQLSFHADIDKCELLPRQRRNPVHSSRRQSNAAYDRIDLFGAAQFPDTGAGMHLSGIIVYGGLFQRICRGNGKSWFGRSADLFPI